MSLRDLNTGDRFTAEFEVEEVNRYSVRTTSINEIFFRDEGKTIVNVTKLPPRARPVRKGDEIVADSLTRGVFVGTLGGVDVVMFEDGPDTLVHREWTHADGTPIDWGASE